MNQKTPAEQILDLFNEAMILVNEIKRAGYLCNVSYHVSFLPKSKDFPNFLVTYVNAFGTECHIAIPCADRPDAISLLQAAIIDLDDDMNAIASAISERKRTEEIRKTQLLI